LTYCFVCRAVCTTMVQLYGSRDSRCRGFTACAPIEETHHRCRLHSALDYRSPEEFENESEERNDDASFGAATKRVFKTLTGNQ
jgi:hypothetical protein